MRRILAFFLLCLTFSVQAFEKRMVIIIPSYNNLVWYQKNLSSILAQTYRNYRVIYIDDCSPDGTGQAVEEYLRKNDDRKCVSLIYNRERRGALANLYYAIHSCDDDEIAVLVDGDDWLYHPHVLQQLSDVYSSGEIWFTHGRLIEYPGGGISWCEPLPPKVISERSYRRFKCPSHLRTFYVGLFKKIRLEDLQYKGEFLKMAWDMAIMYPLAEMAEERHAFIHGVNYVYNMANPINDNKVNPDLQNFLDHLIRNRPSYPRLEGAPF